MDTINQDYLQTVEASFSKYTLMDEAKFLIYETLQANTRTPAEFIENCYKLSFIADASKLTNTVITKKTASALLQLILNKEQESKQETKISFTDFLNEDEENDTEKTVKRVKFIYDHSYVYVDSMRDLLDMEYRLGNTINPRLSSNKLLSTDPNSILGQVKFFKLRKQFMLKHPNFKLESDYKQAEVTLHTVDSLIGSTGEITVFGIIFTDFKEKYFIQDEHGRKELNLRDTTFGDGFFYSGSMVVAQGRIVNDKFKVNTIIQPPQPVKELEFNNKFNRDYFGAIFKSFLAPEAEEKRSYVFPGELKSLAEQLVEDDNLNNILNGKVSSRNLAFIKENVENYFIVICSEVDLSSESCLVSLEKLVSGYNDNTPFILVLMGNFSSVDDESSIPKLKVGFSKLAQILKKNPYFCQEGTLVILRGPNDLPLAKNYYPQDALPELFAKELRKTVGKVIFSTNPGRFVILGKEFVFFRSDLHFRYSKIAYNPRDLSFKESCYNYFMTILHQGRFLPMGDKTSLITDFDGALHLLPNPDYLICCDSSCASNQTIYGTVCINTGPFNVNSSFTSIYPRLDIVRQEKIN